MATTGYPATTAPRLQQIGAGVLRYGLAIIVVGVGALKFTAYESFAVAGFVVNSPLFSWIFDIVGPRTFAGMLGVVEIAIGLLIAARPFSPRLSALGSVGATLLFLVTLTFVLTTPEVWQAGYGFPYPSPAPGQFLLKDLVLLGASIWTAGEALSAARAQQR